MLRRQSSALQCVVLSNRLAPSFVSGARGQFQAPSSFKRTNSQKVKQHSVILVLLKLRREFGTSGIREGKSNGGNILVSIYCVWLDAPTYPNDSDLIEERKKEDFAP